MIRNRRVAATLAVVGVLLVSIVLTAAAYAVGDITKDGTVNMRDVLKLYQIAGGNGPADEETATLADVTGDGFVNMRDVLKLYQDVSNNSGGETEKDPIVGDEVEDDW